MTKLNYKGFLPEWRLKAQSANAHTLCAQQVGMAGEAHRICASG
ncbi:hypothetical protein [Undibacterium sp.]|nr:hypothetical protein [Undibacterium sp.]